VKVRTYWLLKIQQSGLNLASASTLALIEIPLRLPPGRVHTKLSYQT